MIQDIIKKYKYKLFLIAYSGGMDSTVLLYQLLKIKQINPKISIRAIHINHNIHSNSKKWQDHCYNTCKKYNIPLIIEKISVNVIQNIEEQLRIKRYNLIYKHLFNNEILLTGHHLNDQCETLFLSLKRGSGPTGLSAMSNETIFGKTKIVRPFLTKTKKELKKWANLNNLIWIEDFTNFNTNYDRNFIRHNVLPILEKKWPFFLKNCFRTTKICKEETKLKNILLQEKIQKFLHFNESLNIKSFEDLKEEVCKALIRYWISLKNIKSPSYKTIQRIYNEIICSQKNINLKIIIQKNEIRCYKKSLYFIETKKNIKNMIVFWHDTNHKLILPNNLGYIIKNNTEGMNIPRPQNSELINIRFQCDGKILILGKHKQKYIKKIWQEYNIPPWLRNQIPLLFYNNQLVSALGVFVVNQNIKKENQNEWNISWINSIQLNYYDNFIFN
ncbi:tRNA lysidine(34) synthetase TilS [Buchnera aphidicola (Aphis helianthi)]|uniref:tRNA(Ile)-lysidine synthase n=1 Tax=Buchnera aphidicola (Aphis helianthi) TaxID=2315802 RepID=A0A4D6XW05_9GAMM|nr:tRNA lysidine(34) synthetase TilS [Buchnera aphidicola]QCI16945.1 tRNA lysidine(34) synthetase TilS [Buchnera aphidicola (Aphis helianthi)]